MTGRKSYATLVGEQKEKIETQQKVIDYMRQTVAAYVNVYHRIGVVLNALEEDEETPIEMENEIMQLHDLLQPILTLYEDTKPENIPALLAGHGLSQIKRAASNTIN